MSRQHSGGSVACLYTFADRVRTSRSQLGSDTFGALSSDSTILHASTPVVVSAMRDPRMVKLPDSVVETGAPT